MVVIRTNLLDRIDQTYGFFDSETEAEEEEFIKEVRKISKRKPHNYNFLSKYLLVVPHHGELNHEKHQQT